MSARNSGIAIVTCALLIFLPVLLGCGGGIEFDEFNWSFPGRIVFTSDRDGAQDIYIMKPDGSDLTNLTNNPALDTNPVISPDGSKIAFVSNRYGSTYEICVMSSKGGAVTRLTSSSSGSWQPGYSPDGSKIVFVRAEDICITSSTGGAVTYLTSSGVLERDVQPSFSPDGSRIIFSSNRGGSFDIYTMNLNGGSVKRLTHDSADNITPVFSPDGSQIAFMRQENHRAATGLFVMNSDGSGLKRLTDNLDGYPSFSPDGSRITFARGIEDENVEEIYIMRLSGLGTREPLRLTHSPSGTFSYAPFFGNISH